MKSSQIQRDGAREPRQERSRYKVQLILEATMRLLEKDGIEALTTNAVAASAGVSIGTLYQFFPNKAAILDTLADHEISAMSNRVATVMEDETIGTTEERIAAIVNAVAASYGARHSAHRQVMAHSLGRSGNRLSPLLARLVTHLTNERQVGAIRHAIGETDAFVLAHAFAGVLRATISDSEHSPQQDAIARGLARLVINFLR